MSGETIAIAALSFTTGVSCAGLGVVTALALTAIRRTRKETAAQPAPMPVRWESGQPWVNWTLIAPRSGVALRVMRDEWAGPRGPYPSRDELDPAMDTNGLWWRYEEAS